ncbi:MAG: hypothetical protein QOJ92_1976 [Frankiales bacterium]|nr:hypothetical protein [Frankiales bacterium]
MFELGTPSAEVADLDAALGKVTSAGVPIDDERVRANLQVLLPLKARLDAIIGVHLREFDARDISQLDGVKSTTGWVVAQSRIGAGVASGLLQTGRRMARFPDLAAALEAGQTTAAHLRLLDRCVAGLPEELVSRAVEFLTPYAKDCEPTEFADYCQRLRETLLPELTDKETEDLDREQWLDVSEFDGGLKLDGMLRGINAEAFATALARFTQLRPDDDRSPKLRRADGLGDMARAGCGAEVSGLAPVQVTVVCDLVTLERAAAAAWKQPDPFASWLPAAEEDLVRGARGERTGVPIDWRTLIGLVTSGEVRRLVLGPNSEILDLGRTQRFFSHAQRIALRRGRHRCAAKGCRVPWVEYDHRRAWAEGGATDVGNGEPFCGHHNRLRTQGWEIEALPHGKFRFIKPLDWHLRRKRRRSPRIA